MDNSKISWTDATWNPVNGCTPVSEGCRNCYAATMAFRFSGPGEQYDGLAERRGNRAVFNGTMRLLPARLDQPLRWKRPRKIFVNSMSDLFHEGIETDFIARVFAVMVDAKRHVFQVLTKRPERMAALTNDPAFWRAVRGWLKGNHLVNASDAPLDGSPIIRPNIWLGTSVEDQKAYDSRVPYLLDCKAEVLWLSMEPLLGPVENMEANFYLSGRTRRADKTLTAPASAPRVGWVVVGGESGPGARVMLPAHARSILAQCRAADVPFFFKQHGTGATVDPDVDTWRREAGWLPQSIHRKGGDTLDGKAWHEYPPQISVLNG